MMKIAAKRIAEVSMTDYKRIRLASKGYRKLRTADTALFHAQHRSWIQQKLTEPFEGKTVIITHMAPSHSFHPKYMVADVIL
jgi:hypothetical protein